MGTTSIEWTDESANPIRARRKGSGLTKGGYKSGVGHCCEKVSPGCKNCYSSATQPRFGLPVFQEQRGGDVECFLDAEVLASVLRRRKPTKFFWCDMTDMFGSWVPNEWIAACFGVMAATPHHTHQVLTKRANRMREWFALPGIAARVDLMKHVALAGRIEEVFAPECEAPVEGWPGYFVTSKGRVLTNRGAPACLWCNADLGEFSARRKFCSDKCRVKADYEQRMGRWTPPEETKRELQPMANETGHSRVMLYRGSETWRPLIHRLVLGVFGGEDISRADHDVLQGCHLDGDATNNALWNLAWGTQERNWDDRKRHGDRRSYAKLTLEQVAELRAASKAGVSGEELGRRFGISSTEARAIVAGDVWKPEYAPEWPLASVHLGVSVEDQQRADERIPLLLQTPAEVRFISYEPALGPLDLSPWIQRVDHCGGCGAENPPVETSVCPSCGRADDMITTWGDAQADRYRTGARYENGGPGPDDDGPPLHWVIVGGESGHQARSFDADWARSVVQQCKAADVSCFVKQMGSNAIDSRHADVVGPDGKVHYSRPVDSEFIKDARERIASGRERDYTVTAHSLTRLLRSKKGGDMQEWPPELRVRQFPEAAAASPSLPVTPRRRA